MNVLALLSNNGGRAQRDHARTLAHLPVLADDASAPSSPRIVPLGHVDALVRFAKRRPVRQLELEHVDWIEVRAKLVDAKHVVPKRHTLDLGEDVD